MDLIPKTDRIAHCVHLSPDADTSHVRIAECDICGWLEWTSSTRCKAGEAPSHSVDAMGPSRVCPICAQAQLRAPEVFRWVLSVMAKAKEK